jgi:hypothetical protein
MKAMTFTGCSLIAMVALAGTVSAQPAAASAPQTVRSGSPQRDTLNKLMRRISVDFQEKRLEDVVAFVKDFSTADIEAFWIDDQHTEGLDKEKVITVKVDNVTVLSLLEKVLEKAHPDSGGEATWQMSEQGTCQIGPRDRLNKYRRIQIYDINDLLMELPNYTDVPRIDLQQALQASQSGGGGSSQSPFQNDQGREDPAAKARDRQTKADDLATLIRDLVEPEQWTENGGNGGSIRYYQGTLIVNAADYIHRGIDGYRYWPGAQTVAMKDGGGRRYVTLTGDTGLSKLNGIAQQPVSAVVGGQIIQSNGPGGGR